MACPCMFTGHFATLTTTIDQSSDHTKLTWSLAGVPKGMEDEIQRNIIAERVLGLPKDAGVDKNVPFNQLKLSK